jgi:hypothetical protein
MKRRARVRKLNRIARRRELAAAAVDGMQHRPGAAFVRNSGAE